MRGKLLIYLGAAPGVGTNRRMLDEGAERSARGEDVVVAGADPAALLARRPGPNTVLIEDLAGAPDFIAHGDMSSGNRYSCDVYDNDLNNSRDTQRWQDVQTLLEAGIDVVTTLDVRHLASLADVVHRITGAPRTVTVPDAVVRAADQIELVDLSPETLRRRLERGEIYPLDRITPDLDDYYRLGNLAALRELALLWLADQVDEGLERYRAAHRIREPWPTRERVVVALPADAAAPALLRRAARIARQGRAAGAGDGELLAVHVARPGDPAAGGDRAALNSPAASDTLAAQRDLAAALGGSHHVVVGEDVPRALVEFARARGATQLILGASRRGRAARLLTGPGVGERTVLLSGEIDVHLVNRAAPLKAVPRRLREPRPSWLPWRPSSFPRPRRAHDSAGPGARSRDVPPPDRLRGALAAALVPPALTALLSHVAHGLSLTSQVLLYLLAVVAIARLGGILSALAAAIWASLLLDYYFISPIHSASIADANNAIALVVFVMVALTVASVVDLAAKQSRRAALASAEAEALNALAVAVLRGDEAITALLDGFRETFALTSVALLQRAARDDAPRPDGNDDPARWTVVAAAGSAPPRVPAQADTLVAAGSDAVLALCGRTLSAGDQRVLSAFAAQAAAALERRRLAQTAAHAANLEAADRMRTALLAAVSHDLRTPLAAARAAVGTLRDPELDVRPPDRVELLEVADESLDRLTRLVENLLDMSRLQAGALKPRLEPTAADEIVPRALDEVPGAAGRVRLEPVAPGVPLMLADGPLLERVIVNLVGNAVRYTDTPIVITLTARAGLVELRCADRGPGIPETARDLVFRPFQRLGDRDNTTGVGLGLALARGLVEAMGGTLTPQPTPGGGVTMVVALPAAAPQDDPGAPGDDVPGNDSGNARSRRGPGE